jgi:cytochrome P450
MSEQTTLGDVQEFNPMVSPHREDPHLFYRWSRDERPVTFSATIGAYMVTRYEDLKAIVADPDTFSSLPAVPSVWNNPPEVLTALEGCVPEHASLVNTDEPQHDPIRKAFDLAFTGRRVRALGPEMEAKANELIDGFLPQGSADLVSKFAKPYVRHVLSLAIGVPKEDIPRIQAWNDAWMTLFSPLLPLEDKLEAAKQYKDYEAYALDLIDQRRSEPRDDLVSDLINGADGVEPVSREDALYIFRGANSAGFDTTRDTITSSILMMMRNRDFWDGSIGDQRRVTRVIEETLRLDAPHRGLMRLTTRDTELAGTPLSAGSVLLLLFGSGNRDERHFPEPDVADIDRDNVRDHLAFGHGIHHCPGAPLARAETRTAIQVLQERIPSLQLAAGFEPTYEASYFFRSLEHLHVTW